MISELRFSLHLSAESAEMKREIIRDRVGVRAAKAKASYARALHVPMPTVTAVAGHGAYFSITKLS